MARADRARAGSSAQARLPAILVLAAMAMTGLAGCGRKAPPMPPVIRKADQTRDLKVVQESEEAVLRWGYPSLTTAGGPLPDVEEVEVWRAALPVGQEPAQGPGQEELQLQLLNAHGELIRRLDPSALELATRGPALEVRDDLVAWYEANKERMPLVIWYAVRTRCCGARQSAFSNIARLMPQPPPDPPEDLALEATEEGIVITWQVAEGMGALVERSTDGRQWQSITAQPVTDGTRRDRGVQQGRTWHYRLRAVRDLGKKGRVIGDPGASASIDYPDIFPPSLPSNLVCLPEGDMVRLRWQSAADASFYRIFRMRDAETWRQLGIAEGTSFEDDEPPVGNLTYAVKSVDDAGNDSEATTCTTVMGMPP